MNKYALFFNINKNLYYLYNTKIYNNLIYNLYFNDRDFDIYIDIDNFCYDIFNKHILNKINKNNLFKNIKFNIKPRCSIVDTYINIFNNLKKYNMIGYYNCAYKNGLKCFSFLNHNQYGIYTQIYELDKKQYTSGGIENYLNENVLFFTNNIKTDTNKILNCLKNYVDYSNPHVINHCLFHDILCDNVCYIGHDLNLPEYTSHPVIDTSNCKYYWLDDTYKNIDIQNINIDIQNVNNNTIHPSQVKYNNIQIRRYILNYTDEFLYVK